MSFDPDNFTAVRRRDSDHTFLLACLAEMEGSTTGLSSLEIHAPLEVMARYALLPQVASAQRERARRNMAKAAGDFAETASPPAASPVGYADATPTVDWIDSPWEAVGDSLSEATRWPRNLKVLITRVLQQVGGAGHGQILLHHVLDADPHVRRKLLPHMQMFIRAFCEDQSTDRGAVIPQIRPLLHASPGAIEEFLGGIRRSRTSTLHTGIRGVMARGQSVDVPEVSDSTRAKPFEVAGTACIAAARIMLTADADMEYGWSHCMTLSEAAWGFVDRGTEDEVAASVALSYVAAFVSALGFPGWQSPISAASASATGITAFRQALASASPDDAVAICLGATEDVMMEAWGDVISRASALEDAHLVKYVHACFRSAARRPDAECTFLAAATRLLSRWLSR